MELKKILIGLEDLKVKGDLGIEIKQVKDNSFNLEKGDMFVAIKGFASNGHDYIFDAIEKGVVALVMQEDCISKEIIAKIPENIVVIVTKDTRYALAIISCNYFKNPSKKMKLVGITGTKGKTTTTYMIRDILMNQGIKVGLIGTIASYIGKEKLEDSENTTPESLKLQQLLAKMVEEKCEVVVMEVSSQSLKLSRVAGCDFYTTVFTNIAREHISEREHKDMEEYFNEKLKLFAMSNSGFLNIDDLQTKHIISKYPDTNLQTYGIDNSCDYLAKDITITSQTSDFKVKIGERNERIKVSIPGRFSVYNALAAICVCLKVGCDVEKLKEAMLEISVPGRSQIVKNKKELTVMIDYAHTPESLEKILSSTKAYTRGRLISVFGCGGNRDKTKRPMMGEVSGRIADYSIITSDNPRNEKPEDIVNDVAEGTKKTNGKFEVVVNRIEAIKKAIKMADSKDVIIIAGKGHEQYQEIKGVKHDFDEEQIVKDIINEIYGEDEEDAVSK